MKRRDFISLLGSAAAGSACPSGAWAQRPKLPVLGFLASASEAGYTSTLASIRGALNESGYFEKKNLLIEYRWADFQYERLPALAADLVKRQVDVIFATGSVVSALADAEEIGEIISAFRLRRIIVTGLDMARRFGALTAAVTQGARLVAVTRSPRKEAPLEMLSAVELAQMLLR